MKDYIMWEKEPAKDFVNAYLLGNGRLAVAVDSRMHAVNEAAGQEVFLTGIAPDHAEPSYTPVTPRCVYKDPEESDALRFACCARVIACDGTVFSDGARVYVNDASFALIAVTAATNYAGFEKERDRDEKKLLAKLRRQLNDIQEGYEEIKKRHIADYQNLYGRVDLELGHAYTAAPGLPAGIWRSVNREGAEFTGWYPGRRECKYGGGRLISERSACLFYAVWALFLIKFHHFVQAGGHVRHHEI